MLEYLLRKVKCDPNQTTKSDRTPLELAGSNQDAVKLLLIHGAKPPYENWSEYIEVTDSQKPAEAYAKMFLLGFPGGGKTSIASSLKVESHGVARFVNWLRKIPDVALRTAGIIPDDIISKQFGRMTLYDLAGHSEFYASHDATLRNALSGSPSSIIVLVSDMRGGGEPFRKSVTHFCNFAENLFQQSENCPYLILVGSHADQASSADIHSCQTVVESLKCTSTFSSFRFKGFVTLDCRFPESRGMALLRFIVSDCCQELKQNELISFRENCYLVFLLDKFFDKPAVTIGNVIFESKRSDHFGAKYIPTDPSVMADVCSELNKRGNILFLPDETNLEKSWVVLQKDVLLKCVTGSIFAPSGFKEHKKGIASDTGIISTSKLSTHFPDLDLDLMVSFMCSLQFCHEVKDPEILKQLFVDHSTSADQFLFFPGLVTIAVPREEVWDSNIQFTHQSAWILRCRNPDQFLSARFLHVVVHRLAFSFAMAHSPSSPPEQVLLHKRCSVWKNGLFWRTNTGVDAIVEVIEQEKVIIYIRCRRGHESKGVILRSSVISKVIQALREYCPKVDVDECFVRPDSIRYPVKESDETISMSEVADSIVSCESFACDSTGQLVEIDSLLHFEPFINFGEDILHELFAKGDSEVDDAFLVQVADRAHSNTNKYIKLLDISTFRLDNVLDAAHSGDSHKLLRVFQLWRDREHSYANLRSSLSAASVFAGRNPLLIRTVKYKK